jgi:hypothetical protein
MAGRFTLNLRAKRRGPFVIVPAFAFKCGACGQDFITAGELVAHMIEQRRAA